MSSFPAVQWSLPADSALAVQPEWAVQGLSFAEAVVGYWAQFAGVSTSRPVLECASTEKVA